MDNTVLSEDIIAAVKNRPEIDLFYKNDLELSASEYITELVREHNKKLDDFLMFCLLQLGYTGPREQFEIHKFILDNGIELEMKPSRRELFTMYIVRCESQNYEKGLIVKDNIYKYINDPATFKVYTREEK